MCLHIYFYYMKGLILMDNLFSGLEDLGFKDLNNVDLYEISSEDTSKKETVKKELSISDILYDKSVDCPVCGNSFKNKTVKTGKARIASYDTDFMPLYQDFNAMFYDVIVCPKCGYSALPKYFDKIKSEQAEAIKILLSPKFKAKVYPESLTLENAIEKYKLALLNTVIKKGRISEKAYTCLKLGWLYRLAGDAENEASFLSQALIGFKEAFTREPYPICGMDVYTLMYMIGELARRTGNNDEAIKWLGKVIVTPNINPKLKEKARDMKDLIRENE